MRQKTDTIEYFLRKILDQLYEIRVLVGKAREPDLERVVTWGIKMDDSASVGYEIVNVWKPISTAPIGIDIIVYCKDMPERPIRLVRSKKNLDDVTMFVEELPNGAHTYSGATTARLPFGAWITVYPSHWMPLPEPPIEWR